MKIHKTPFGTIIETPDAPAGMITAITPRGLTQMSAMINATWLDVIEPDYSHMAMPDGRIIATKRPDEDADWPT